MPSVIKDEGAQALEGQGPLLFFPMCMIFN